MSLTGQVKQVRGTVVRSAFRPGVATDLSALAAVNLFTITDGPIVVEGLIGIVTTVIGNVGATTIALNLTGTAAYGATAVPVAIATASIQNHVVGTMYTLAGAVGAALTMQTGAARGVGIYSITNRQAWVPGTLAVTVGASVNTGIIDWYLQYTPCVPNAYVMPA